MAVVIVSGALANKPLNGGEAWVRLSWLLGFQKLGFETWLLEQIDPATCVDDSGNPVPWADSANLRYFQQVIADFGLQEFAMLVVGDGEEIVGPLGRDLFDLADSADLLVNISGHLRDRRLLARIRRKAYIDIDPGFTQIWQSEGLLGDQLAGYEAHYTIGENIGRAGCWIPACGIPWRPIRQPVVLEQWPLVSKSSVGPLRVTTVASWRGPYGPIQYLGETLGLKVHEFRKFLGLPAAVPDCHCELALKIDPADEADRRALLQQGWRLVDPRRVAAGPDEFRQYVQDSHAEFSVAQGVYVKTRSGWFSDRSVRYLASGKPVLVQDTGLSGVLPLGAGLQVFDSMEGAITGLRRIGEDYPHCCQAARELAESHFDSDRVLGRLAEEMGVAP